MKLTATQFATLRIIRDGLSFANVRATTICQLLDLGLVDYANEFVGYTLTDAGRKVASEAASSKG